MILALQASLRIVQQIKVPQVCRVHDVHIFIFLITFILATSTIPPGSIEPDIASNDDISVRFYNY